MSTSRKLLSIALVLAGVVGLLRWGSGQVDGGGVVGGVVAHDIVDLEVLSACLRSNELVSQIGVHLDAGEPITNLVFRRFCQGPNGERVYLGSVDIAGSTTTFVRFEPGNSRGKPAATYVRNVTAPAPVAHQGVVPNRTGFDFLVSALSAPSPQVRHALATAFGQSSCLTGLRVSGSVSSTSRTLRYRLELFFDGDTQQPKFVAAADLTATGFGVLVLE
ncbi:MAG: hypothetical protein AB7O52_05715 [Planctomycetota bacterium]